MPDGDCAEGKPGGARPGSQPAERPDGTRVPFIPYPTPLHDESGKLVGAVNMLVDITERKRAEEQQALLVRELHHRVKNTLATVQAIMGSTARSADTIEDFKTALIGRIGALAKTHRLLTDEVGAVAFGDLLHNELDAFDDGSDGRITLSGPEVLLSSQLAVSLGMAVHELTTNAAKYGSLSVYGGKVDVTWSVTIEAKRRTARFRLGRKRRTGGVAAQAAGLRLAAAGIRAARADPGQGHHRLPDRWRAYALLGADAGGSDELGFVGIISGPWCRRREMLYTAHMISPPCRARLGTLAYLAAWLLPWRPALRVARRAIGAGVFRALPRHHRPPYRQIRHP